MAKLFVKVSLLMLLVGFVLVIVGQATSYWLVKPGHNYGLWKYCFDGAHETKGICNNLYTSHDADGKLWTTRIMTILACVVSFITMLLLFVYLRRNDGSANLRRIKAVIALSILSAIFIFVGIGVYSAYKESHLGSYHFGWSFILTTVAGALHLLLIVPLLLEIHRATSLGAYESI